MKNLKLELDKDYVINHILTDHNTMTTISNIAVELIEKALNWDPVDISNAEYIIDISNALYNNTSADVLPLDDGVYDQLLEVYKKYVPTYKVGAAPMKFDEIPEQYQEPEEKVMCTGIKDTHDDSRLYIQAILQDVAPVDPRLRLMATDLNAKPFQKKLVDTPHMYPDLVGTLDKCKFVLNNEAREKGVFDKPSVAVFERDFLGKHVRDGIITTNEEIEMVAELKFDGISVEADVCGDTIISARSRGDTGEDIATDLTPILGGYKFPNAKDVPKDITFGIKFEAMISKFDLQMMSLERGKSYKNCRNAIIGLFGSSDAYDYVDKILLMPIATSLEMDRITELKFLNKYYSSGQYNRYSILKGNYNMILYEVNEFLKSAEMVRPSLPYLIDGVVISYIDPKIIATLGRENSVNKYSIAIKFNPKVNRTIFTGYTFSMGKSGDIIPMAHFKPCEFIGTIHDKTTAHSYQRFKNLALKKGDMVDVEYVNEVICYITKPDIPFNRDNPNPLEEFIKVCPYCGTDLVISDSGKSISCPNPKCPERNIMRMVDMIDRLGFKNFSEESVRALNLTSLTQLLNMTYDKCKILGEVNANKFMAQVNRLKTEPISDYKILSAVGFDGIANEKWKIILHEMTIDDIINTPSEVLYNKLIVIPGIGPAVAKTILNDKILYADDVNAIMTLRPIIKISKGAAEAKKIAFSGFRNEAFLELLNSYGYDASDSAGVTKKTFCLIVADKNSTSTKMEKAKKYGIPIMTMSEFISAHNISVDGTL